MIPRTMEFGTLIILVLSLVGVMTQTPCSVPCTRPNGFNPNLLNPTVICPDQEQHSSVNIRLIKSVLEDLKHLTHRTKNMLARRIQEDNPADVEGVHLPDVHALSTINNMTSLRNKLHDDMLIYNVFIERVQWVQRCLFKLEGQINTVASRLNLIRAGTLTLVCESWDGQRKSADHIDINYLDRQGKDFENRLAHFCMKTLNVYINHVIHKIDSL